MPKQGEIARRPAWPEDTVFRRLLLDVESDSCEHCGATLHLCGYRFHRIHTLQGPVELPCRLAHCSDCLCPLRCQTLRLAAGFEEGTLDEARRQAMVAALTLIGALTVSRVVTDRALSDAILRSAQDSITGSQTTGGKKAKRSG